jgi:hypothetical protein
LATTALSGSRGVKKIKVTLSPTYQSIPEKIEAVAQFSSKLSYRNNQRTNKRLLNNGYSN